MNIEIQQAGLKKAAPSSFRYQGRYVQTYKPDPVTTARKRQLPSFIYAAYPLRPSEDMGRATQNRSLFGLAARKVYPSVSYLSGT
jgi:hypothetical protein